MVECAVKSDWSYVYREICSLIFLCTKLATKFSSMNSAASPNDQISN